MVAASPTGSVAPGRISSAHGILCKSGVDIGHTRLVVPTPGGFAPTEVNGLRSSSFQAPNKLRRRCGGAHDVCGCTEPHGRADRHCAPAGDRPLDAMATKRWMVELEDGEHSVELRYFPVPWRHFRLVVAQEKDTGDGECSAVRA